MTGFYDVMDFFAFTLRFLGAVVFGVGCGWMVLYLLRSAHANWQLSAAAFLGLLAAFVLIGHWVSGAATLGGFGLGAGGALLAWGLGAPSTPSSPGRAAGRTTTRRTTSR
jgi:hypothetical protein